MSNLPVEMENSIVVEFPLRGEWVAPNTPGKKIPSHGIDMLGQRYAYDLLQVMPGKKGMHFYRAGGLKYLFFGVRLDECLSWGQQVYAPCDGRIVKAEDGLKERARVHLLSDMFVVLKNAFFFDPAVSGLQPVLGNNIIMEIRPGIFAFFAHLQKGSILVSPGQDIKKGQPLAKVGHSGNSTAPHLHFHLMDNIDMMKAKGIPCAFEACEVYRDGKWITEKPCVPKDTDIIRPAA